jgi:hypothetical protein
MQINRFFLFQLFLILFTLCGNRGYSQTLHAVCLEKADDRSYFSKEETLLSLNGNWHLTSTQIPANFKGFRTQVKVHQNHFSFTTNRILLRCHQLPSELEKRFLSNYGKLSSMHSKSTLLVLETRASNTEEIAAIIEEIKSSGMFQTVQRDQFFTLDACSNDPLYPNQWHLENTGNAIQFNGSSDADVDGNEAWSLSTGSSVIVSVMDSGIDTLHSEFSGRLLPGYDAFATQTSDTKGYPALDFPENAHGTACAGIIGAEQNNAQGVSGIAPDVQLIPVRMFTYVSFQGQTVPFTNMAALLAGISYSVDSMNADVISCSAGLTDEYISLLGIDTTICNEEMRLASQLGRNGKGTVLFFSAGNDNINQVIWPANLPETIAVGASNMCDRRKSMNDCSPETWWGSSFGERLDLVAPGVKIATTDMGGALGYGNDDYTLSFNGTSAACPLAAGIGALLLSENPNLSADEVRHILNATAERVSTYSYDSLTVHGTWNTEMGHGRINAHQALIHAFEAGSAMLIHAPLVVFPNPVNDALTVKLSGPSYGQLRVTDMTGKVIHCHPLNGNETITISSEKWNDGAYTLSLESANGVERIKFLVAH